MKRLILVALLALPAGAAEAQEVTQYQNFLPASVTVAGSATLLAPLRARNAVTIYNGGSTTVYVGGPGVTTTTGFPLAAGNAYTLNTSAALYGITSGTAASVGVGETF